MSLGQKQRLADKAAPDKQEEGAELDQAAEQEQPEHSRAQAMFGNSAVAAFMSPAMEGMGIDGNVAALTEYEQQGLQHGGDDDDDAGDALLTLEDLTRSWDQRGKPRTDDTVAFLEPMPEDDLPPEQADWIALVRAQPAPPVRRGALTDGLLQPSPEVIAGRAMNPWLTEAHRWVADDPATRTLSTVITQSAAFLQNPWGRVLPTRALLGAATTLMLVDGPALRSDDPYQTAHLHLCLELAGGRWRVDEVHGATQARGEQLPLARGVLGHHLPATAEVDPEHTTATLAEATTAHLTTVLADMLALTSARGIVPDLPDLTPAGPDPDDPLGLDQVLNSFAGGAPDPQAGAYHAALQAAERLAGATALLRVRCAGCAVAAHDAARPWITADPEAELAGVANWLDRESKRVLSLVVEVARAIRARSVEPAGIRNGLKRAARMIDRLRTQVISRLAAACVTILPRSPAPLCRTENDGEDLLSQALADGRPADGRAWVDALADGPDKQTAAALMRALTHPDPAVLVPGIGHAADALRPERPLLATALDLCRGPWLVRTGQLGEAWALSSRLRVMGLERRNGLVVVAAALLAMEAHRAAGDPAGAEAERLDAGVLVYHLGARGALTMLARWTPPGVEP